MSLIVTKLDKNDKKDLEEKKNRIVETLGHYNISITSISATIGPTITLYEIVPDAGIRISKIKNLEDDISLSLAAEGIRIIAPIPGKGTIGIEVPNDSLGCLQDIHWSMGAFGYFPTYTLGNLYAAQLLQKMAEDLGEVDQIIGSGDWSNMLDWLRERIHAKGSLMTPAELIKSATGDAPNPEPFLDYVEKKYSKLYRL